MGKKTVWSVVLLSLFVFIYQIISMILQKTYDMITISGIAATLFFLISFSYNNIIAIFSVVNKVILKFKNPTITWATIYEFHTCNESNISIDQFEVPLQEKLYEIYGKDAIFSMDRSEGGDTSSIQITMTRPENRKFILDVNKDDWNDTPVCTNLNISCTIGYKDTIKELKNNESLYQGIKDIVSLIPPSSKYYKEYNKPIRSLEMIFKNRNPFYGVMLKRINSTEIRDFSLKLKNNDCDIEIKKHCLKVDNAKSKDIFEKIVKEYITLSDLKDQVTK